MNENAERYKTKIAEIQKQIEEQQQKIAIEKRRLEDCIKKEEEKIALLEQNNAEFDPSILNKQMENLRKANEYDKDLTTKIGELGYELKDLKKQIATIDT